MILSGAFEFEKSHNSEVVSRPSDNEELPPVSTQVVCIYLASVLDLQNNSQFINRLMGFVEIHSLYLKNRR